MKNPLIEKIKLFKSFIKDGKIRGESSLIFYKKEISKAEKYYKLIKEGKMTPRIFDKLKDRDKWDVSRALKGVIWCCERCKSQIGKKLPNSPYIEGVVLLCSECGHELTERTPGGQSNPFGYTFIKIKKSAA